MPLILRSAKGSPLSIAEMDGNLEFLYSSSLNPSSSISASYAVTSSYSTTAEQLSGVQTTIVNIPSSSILQMGTTPIELLPAPGAGKYYDYYGYLEYTAATAGYISADEYVVGSLSKYGGTYIGNSVFSGLDNIITGFSNRGGGQETGVTSGTVVSFEQPLNEAISLFTYNNGNPTLGDGTIRAIITYTVRTFGS